MPRKRKQPAPTWPEVRNHVAGQLLGERRRYEARLEEEVEKWKRSIEYVKTMLFDFAGMVLPQEEVDTLIKKLFSDGNDR